MTTDYPFEFLPISDVNKDVIGECFQGVILGEPVEGIEANRSILNALFSNARQKAHNLIASRDVPGWLHEGYRQLELWTAIYWLIDRQDDALVDLKPLAPVGRYGWRYVIDVSLSELVPSRVIVLGTPSERDIADMFTCLYVMALTSEMSNTLHFFRHHLRDTRITYSMDADAIIVPAHPAEGGKLIGDIVKYVIECCTYKRYPALHQYSDDGSDTVLHLNQFLRNRYGIDFSLIMACSHALMDRFSGGSIVVWPGEDCIQKIAGHISTSPTNVRRIFDFLLLDQQTTQTIKRDYLRKSQTERMACYAGIRIPKLADASTLYYHLADTFDDVYRADWHLIVSAGLIAEWRDTLISRVLYGQRPDLKDSREATAELEAIEEAFRKGVFEREVARVMRGHNLHVISAVSEFEEGGTMRPLPCGEIDGIGYDSAKHLLRLVEDKCLAPVTDTRMVANDLKDQYEQRDYHGQVLRKKRWIDANRQVICNEFRRRLGLYIAPDFGLEAVMVTMHPSPLRFVESDFLVMTIGEFDDSLQ